MCFVSFVPLERGYLIGSNRDEHKNRLSALPPAEKKFGKYSCLSPTDAQAGGTWIVCREDGWTFVLLNGAEKAHVPQPPYRKSRGTIIPDLMAVYSPLFAWQLLELENIEPFTIIMASKDLLVEVRWDGEQKTEAFPDPKTAHCWSSSTLYNEEAITKRKAIFLKEVEAGMFSSPENLMNFHTGTYGLNENDIMLNRSNGLMTVSASIISFVKDAAYFQYLDHKTSKMFYESLIPSRVIAG